MTNTIELWKPLKRFYGLLALDSESSIFLLNSREQKLIEAQLKLVKLLALYQKNRLGLVWAAGQLQ